MFVAVELGGQSTRIMVVECASSFDNFTVFFEKTITTSDGPQTVKNIISELDSFFTSAIIKTDYICLAIASFGPVQIDPSSDKFGFILDTPKPNWAQTDILKPIKEALQVYCKEVYYSLESDVSAPAKMWGHVLGKNVAYVTIGTGLGVGFSHPEKMNCEIGHFAVSRHEYDADYETCCPFHRDVLCCEGATCAVALAKKLNCPIDKIKDFLTDEVVESEAHYIAQLCHNATLITDLDVIVLGGGISQMRGLIEKVQSKVDQMNGYYRKAVQIRGDPGINGYASGISSAIYMANSLVSIA